jgi:hypothetical protein
MCSCYYLLVREEGVGNINSQVFHEQDPSPSQQWEIAGVAWRSSAKLWCSWVLFHIDPSEAPLELCKGGMGFGHEACRRHVAAAYNRIMAEEPPSLSPHTTLFRITESASCEAPLC